MKSLKRFLQEFWFVLLLATVPVLVISIHHMLSESEESQIQPSEGHFMVEVTEGVPNDMRCFVMKERRSGWRDINVGHLCVRIEGNTK